jgi:type II secretory pathway pseudopilin PulG
MTRTLHTRFTDQAGFAMPVVIAAATVLMLVAAVAFTSGLTATTSSNRDRQVKVARQAADAGLELALYHLNAVMAGQTLPCVSGDPANLVLGSSAGEWCDPVTDTLADGSTIAYQLSKETLVTGTSPQQVTREIVATGTYLGQRRRVYTEIRATRGVASSATFGISARDKIFVQNNAKIGTPASPGPPPTPESPVDMRTNGTIELKDNAKVCGDVTPGPGQSVTGVSPARLPCPPTSTTPATSQLVFDDYAAAHNDAWTTNNNSRLGCGPGPGKDVCTNSSDILWDESKRELIVQGNATLTLSGDVYSLCRLNLKGNSRLFIAARPAGNPIKFYFNRPSPECQGMTENIMIENGWGITNNNPDPTSLQFFVRGSSTTATKVNIKNTTAGSAATPIMIHAPNSEILLENNAFFNGGLVGKTVELKNDVRFTFDPNSLTPTGSTALVYQPMAQRECSPQPPGAPDSGC